MIEVLGFTRRPKIDTPSGLTEISYCDIYWWDENSCGFFMPPGGRGGPNTGNSEDPRAQTAGQAYDMAKGALELLRRSQKPECEKLRKEAAKALSEFFNKRFDGTSGGIWFWDARPGSTRAANQGKREGSGWVKMNEIDRNLPNATLAQHAHDSGNAAAFVMTTVPGSTFAYTRHIGLTAGFFNGSGTLPEQVARQQMILVHEVMHLLAGPDHTALLTLVGGVATDYGHPVRNHSVHGEMANNIIKNCLSPD